MANGSIFSANVSKVTIDSKDVAGLQAIEYKVIRNRQNIHNIGLDERVGVLYGQLYITGVLRFQSTCPYLDEMIEREIQEYETKQFQIVIEFRARGEALTTLIFDECNLEGKSFTIDANGIGVSDYTFTGTRMREE